MTQLPTATDKMLTCARNQTQIRTVLCENIYNKRFVNSCPIFWLLSHHLVCVHPSEGPGNISSYRGIHSVF